MRIKDPKQLRLAFKRVPDMPDREPMQIDAHRHVDFMRQPDVEEKSLRKKRKKGDDLLSRLSPSS